METYFQLPSLRSGTACCSWRARRRWEGGDVLLGGSLDSSTIGGPIVGWAGKYAVPRWSLAFGGLAAILAAGIGWRDRGRTTRQASH